jgi:hypothetical protein
VALPSAGETIPAEGAEFADAHRALLADSSIQFDFPAYVPPAPPAWLEWVRDWLAWAFPVLRILFYGAAAAALLFLLYLLARRFAGSRWPWRKADDEREDASDWRPDEAPARALLREADALAAEGCFSEAAHLLLFRSIEEIETRRPRLVRPALTSRDIASAPALPEAARSAFAAIVAMVERSLFGGQALDPPEWQECRSAYEQFAFAGAWR